MISNFSPRIPNGVSLSEIAEKLDVPRGSVGTTFGRLEQRSFVRHEGEVAERFEGDYYDQNPDWDADLPDVESESDDLENTGSENRS